MRRRYGNIHRSMEKDVLRAIQCDCHLRNRDQFVYAIPGEPAKVKRRPPRVFRKAPDKQKLLCEPLKRVSSFTPLRYDGQMRLNERITKAQHQSQCSTTIMIIALRTIFRRTCREGLPRTQSVRLQ